MTTNEIVNKALNQDIDLSTEEYERKKAEADAVTAAHGIEGDAPTNEDERERRMRMNYYGSVLNIGMAILVAIDDIANRITTLNNNLISIAGGCTENGCEHSDTSQGPY